MNLGGPDTMRLDRRTFLTRPCAATLAIPAMVRAQTQPKGAAEILLVGGHVLDFQEGHAAALPADVHIRNGEIRAIGRGISAETAEHIDVSGTLIAPGLIDTHWPIWNTLARGFSMSRLGPFAKTMAALAKVWTPEAGAMSVRLAMAEAITSGITTISKWAHNTKDIDLAGADHRGRNERSEHRQFHVSGLSHDSWRADVDLVLIDDVIHKRNGQLTRVDSAELKSQAKGMIAALRQKAEI